MIQYKVKSRLAAVSALLVMGLLPNLSAATDLAAPTGEVILTISGAISETNGPNGASFDLAMLQALPKTGFDTTTIWTEGQSRFEGVPLQALLDAVGAQGATITATALNNYAADIPREVIEEQVPIVAYHIDGNPFSRRDKGPLWIVFPYDSAPAYQSELAYSLSIWQLSALTIRE